MKREVNLRFDDKDIMFDAFIENIADNGNYILSENGYSALFFFYETPAYAYVCNDKKECRIRLKDTKNTMFFMYCKSIQDTFKHNEERYIYKTGITGNEILVTATTIIDE